MEKINEAMVREIVKKVLAEMMTAENFIKEKDASGILKVKTDTVRCEPFSDTPGVYLKDIVPWRKRRGWAPVLWSWIAQALNGH